jgi:hypothetical protein
MLPSSIPAVWRRRTGHAQITAAKPLIPQRGFGRSGNQKQRRTQAWLHVGCMVSIPAEPPFVYRIPPALWTSTIM